MSYNDNFEKDPIYLYRLSQLSSVSQMKLPYRIALSTYLNDILSLNVSDNNSLKLPDYILKGSPVNFNTSYVFPPGVEQQYST